MILSKNFLKDYVDINENIDIKTLADCSVEDMDLCIILANAIDNAIQACIKEKNVHPEIVMLDGELRET